MLHIRLKLNENQCFSCTPDNEDEVFVLIKRAGGGIESVPISSERSLTIGVGDVLMFESYDSVPEFVINAVNVGVAEVLEGVVAPETEAEEAEAKTVT